MSNSLFIQIAPSIISKMPEPKEEKKIEIEAPKKVIEQKPHPIYYTPKDMLKRVKSHAQIEDPTPSPFNKTADAISLQKNIE